MPNGLYCHDTRSRSHNIKISEKVTDYSFVNTVEDNKFNYTRCRVTGSDNDIAFNKETGYLRCEYISIIRIGIKL